MVVANIFLEKARGRLPTGIEPEGLAERELLTWGAPEALDAFEHEADNPRAHIPAGETSMVQEAKSSLHSL